MRRLNEALRMAVLILVAWFTFINDAHARSVSTQITPANGNAAGFSFEVTAKDASDGIVSFRVVVTEKGSKFCTKPETHLSTVRITETSETISPLRDLTFERKDGTILCTFSVSKASLENPDFCFVFTNFYERIVDGKVEYLPSPDFVYARLKDFVKR